MIERRKFDLREAAWLLNACLHAMDDGLPLSSVSGAVSAQLRRYARNIGLDIAESYRSPVGIACQLSIIGIMFRDPEAPHRKTTETFAQVIALYNTDRPAYEKLLKEAKALIDGQAVRETFLNWLQFQSAPFKAEEFDSLYDEIEKFCRSTNVLKEPLFETIEGKTLNRVVDTVNSNKVFRFRHKKDLSKFASAARLYCKFIRENPSVGKAGEPEADAPDPVDEAEAPAIVEDGQTAVIPDATPVGDVTVQLTMDLPHASDVLEDTPEPADDMPEATVDVAPDPEPTAVDVPDPEPEPETPANAEPLFREVSLFDIGTALPLPCEICTFGETAQVDSWARLYIHVLTRLYNRHFVVLLNHRDRNKFHPFGNRMDAYFMRTPAKIAPFLFVDTALEPETMLGYIKDVMDACRRKPEELTIRLPIPPEPVEPAKATSPTEEAEAPATAQAETPEQPEQPSEDVATVEQPEPTSEDSDTPPVEPEEEPVPADDPVAAPLEDQRDAFAKWLLKRHYSERIREGYLAAVTNAGDYAVRNKLSDTRLCHISDADEAEKYIDMLFDDAGYINSLGRNVSACRVALNCYQYFIHYTAAIRAVKAVEPPAPAVTEKAEKPAGTPAETPEQPEPPSETADKQAETPAQDVNAQAHSPAPAPAQKGDAVVVLNLNVPTNMTGTVPVSLSYCGNTNLGYGSWAELYVDFVRLLYHDTPIVLRCYMERCAKQNSPYYGDKAARERMTAPEYIAEGLYIETALDANAVIARIHGLLDICHQNVNRLEIRYRRLPPVADPLLSALEERRLRYVDRRAEGGALWVPGDLFLSRQLNAACADAHINASFIFSGKGCTATGNQSAWYLSGEATPVEPEKTEPATRQDEDVAAGDGSPQEDVSPAVTAPRADQRDAFDKWLRDMHYAERTCRGYVSVVSSVSGYAVRRGLAETELYRITDVDEISKYIDALFADALFVKAVGKNDAIYRSALKRYLDFIVETCPVKPTPEPTPPPVADDPAPAADARWADILAQNFPDGYILGDFLSRFQAAGYYQAAYGEASPLTDAEIDAAMLHVGTVQGDRVYACNAKGDRLMEEIRECILSIFESFSCVYRACIYERYRARLAEISVYTEADMTQRVLAIAGGRFYRINDVYAKPGTYASVPNDCAAVLHSHGGALPIEELCTRLWFIPEDRIKHYLSATDCFMYCGRHEWILVENFPLSEADVLRIGDALEEYFLSNDCIAYSSLPGFLTERLPDLAENASAYGYTALKNITYRYLADRFDFSTSMIAPIGRKVNFSYLFRDFADKRDRFTLAELEAFAKENNINIYFEHIFKGGAVRVSRDEFVHRRLIPFNVAAIDRVLEGLCSGDYMPLGNIPPAMLSILPDCGRRWTGYMLLSYGYAVSEAFTVQFASLSKTSYAGALVRRASGITSYDELMVRVLSDEDGWNTPNEALDLLVRKGYQARRSAANLQEVIARAQRNKAHKK